MKKLLMILLVLVGIVGSVSADTREELTTKFRVSLGEPDSASSSFSDSTAWRWFELAQQRTGWLTLSVHDETTFVYSPTVNQFTIPATRAVRAVHAQVGTRWYDITGDPQALQVSVTRSDSARTGGGTVNFSRVYLQVGGFVSRSTDVLFYEDTVVYQLPSDFRRIQGMLVRANSEWTAAAENPLFLRDTNITQYFIGQDHVDTSDLYVKTTDLQDGDTMRVFYWAGPISGDSVRISYYSQATLMSGDSTECLLDDDMEGFLLEEAKRYYYESIRDYTGAQTMQQNVRGDIRQ